MKDLIITHGALGSASQMAHLAAHLAPFYRIHVLEWKGHGVTPIETPAFTISGFSDQLNAFVRSLDLTQPCYLGYSMGGYIGLDTEIRYPGTLGKIMTLATKYAWDVDTAEKEAGRLNPVKIMEKVPAFGRQLEERHAAVGWEHHLSLTAGMMRDLGRNPVLTPERLSGIGIPVICGVGDKDNMVSVDETKSLADAIPGSGFYVLPGTGHPVEQLNAGLVVAVARHFFGE